MQTSCKRSVWVRRFCTAARRYRPYPQRMSTEAWPLKDPEEMGVAAELLLDQGKVQAAALLIEALPSGMDLVDTAVMDGGENFLIYNMALDVPVSLYQGLTAEVIDEIRDAINL